MTAGGVDVVPRSAALRRFTCQTASVRASWFETAQGRLLTMRFRFLHSLRPHPEEPRSGVSKDGRKIAVTVARSRGFIRPGYAKSRPSSEGAGNAGRIDAPAALRAVKESTQASHRRSAEHVRHSPRGQVLTVSFVVSLVIGLSCHHRRRIISADLIPASRYQDATTSPSAPRAFVCCAHRVHRIFRPTFSDDRETPLSGREKTREEVPVICPSAKAKYFSTRDWTVDSALNRQEKTEFWRNAQAVIPEAAQRLSGIHSSRCSAARWVPGQRLPRKIASLFCRDGASRNDNLNLTPPLPPAPRRRRRARACRPGSARRSDLNSGGSRLRSCW